MVPATTSLTGFSGETTWPLGQLRLLVTIGDITHSTKAWMNFMIVKSLSPYNDTSSPIPREKETRPTNLTVPLHPNFPDQEVVVEGSLSDKGRTELCALLKTNLDIFAWQPSDMTGVPRSIAEHRLNIREGCPSVRQKKIGQAPDHGSGAWLILTNPDGVEFTYALRFQFAASNNKSEYEVLIASLRIATQMGVKNIQANVDSKLLANQVLGTYVAKEDNMIKYLDLTKGLVSGFKTFSISQVPQSRNKKADALSKIASTSFAHLSKQVLVEVLETKSITGKEVTAVIEEEGPTWMTELVNYLKEGILPGDEKEARKLRLKARHMHAGPRSVVAKAIRLGYFWPTMHKDAQDMIRKCSDYQIHHPVTRHPQQPLTSITAPWPFYKWGIDIAGPFLEGPRKVKFLIVAMDYFTKWIEAKAVATITGGQVKKFVWDNIVCRFGIQGEIISDNGKQFTDNPFKDWCNKLNITQRFASVKHPQSNGLVKRANRSLGEGIKARLGEGNKNWVEELPHVLWAHRTMIKSSHGDTPFSLTYRTKAVIPAEIGMPIYHTTAVDVVNNDEELRLNLDLLEELRELAAMSEARSKSKMIKYYNSRVRGVAFKPGDFVYRSNDASHAVAGGKLGPK
nr:reverse transcriptase domain-containing protein [Tanacetum cinerariifolium]